MAAEFSTTVDLRGESENMVAVDVVIAASAKTDIEPGALKLEG